MEIKASMVKELRDKSGAPMMDCKVALVEAGGDLDRAHKILRQRGQATAAKRSSKSTSEGAVGAYIHAGGRIGVLVEVNCETEKIVAGRMEKFYQEFCLLEQPFVRDPNVTVRDVVSAVIAKTGENIRVKRFARFVLGQDGAPEGTGQTSR